MWRRSWSIVIVILALWAGSAVQASGILTVYTPLSMGQGVIGNQLKSMVERFEAKTGAKVEVVTPPYDSYNDKFVQAAATGVAPDVFWCTEGKTFGRKGLLAPLNEMIAKSTQVKWDDFFGAPKQFSFDELSGLIYAIPLETDARVLVWNKDLFLRAGVPADKPPVYWDEMLALNRRLTRIEDGRLMTAGFEFAGEGQWYAIWLGVAGGQMWDESVTPPIAIPDLAAMVRGLTFVHENVDILGGWPAWEEYQARTPSLHARFQMSTSMYVAGSWEVRNLIINFPDLGFGIGSIPMDREHGKPYTLAGGWQVSIPAGAKDKQLAWQFIEYFTNTENIAEWAQVNGYVPPRYSAGRSYRFQQWPEKPIVEAAMGGAAWPPDYSAGYSWNTAFWDVVKGVVPPQTAAEKTKASMQAAANAFYEQRQ